MELSASPCIHPRQAKMIVWHTQLYGRYGNYDIRLID